MLPCPRPRASKLLTLWRQSSLLCAKVVRECMCSVYMIYDYVPLVYFSLLSISDFQATEFSPASYSDSLSDLVPFGLERTMPLFLSTVPNWARVSWSSLEPGSPRNWELRGDTQLGVDWLGGDFGFSFPTRHPADLLAPASLLSSFFFLSSPCLGARVRAPCACKIRYFYL